MVEQSLVELSSNNPGLRRLFHGASTDVCNGSGAVSLPQNVWAAVYGQEQSFRIEFDNDMNVSQRMRRLSLSPVATQCLL